MAELNSASEDGNEIAFTQIWAVYFSPTGSTKTVALSLAYWLGKALGLPVKEVDFTSPEARKKIYPFGEQDFVVFASPVYAGRLPNKIAPDYARCFLGAQTVAVPVVVFGNRSPDGAWMEFRQILEENGFLIAGGAAVASRHAFTDRVGTGRPNADDESEVCAFAEYLADQCRDPEGMLVLNPAPEEELPPYYTPLKEDGTPANFLKAVPVTDREKCDHCGLCREACPMGSINEDMDTKGICIKCQACVRKCPKKAKYFTDEDFLSHVRYLEKYCTKRAENDFIYAGDPKLKQEEEDDWYE